MNWIKRFWQWLKRKLWTGEPKIIEKRRTYYGPHGKQEVKEYYTEDHTKNVYTSVYSSPPDVYGPYNIGKKTTNKGHHRFVSRRK